MNLSLAFIRYESCVRKLDLLAKQIANENPQTQYIYPIQLNCRKEYYWLMDI